MKPQHLVALLCSILLTVGFSDSAFCQSPSGPGTLSVSGTVTDSRGEPVIGASVVEPGTNHYAISDLDGSYSLTVSSASAVIVCQALGFADQTIEVKGRQTLNIELQENSENLEESVVIGYGTAKKKDLTGSIATVNAERLETEIPKSIQDIIRSGADDLTPSEANTIEAILSERARELYYEEERHIEMVRMSYMFAKTGKACETTGHTYHLENICGPDTPGTYCKDAGVNFWFDYVSKYNNFYNSGIANAYHPYTISVHHMLWPIPESSITSDTGGTINQNVGYAKIKTNITPRKIEK